MERKGKKGKGRKARSKQICWPKSCDSEGGNASSTPEISASEIRRHNLKDSLFRWTLNVLILHVYIQQDRQETAGKRDRIQSQNPP